MPEVGTEEFEPAELIPGIIDGLQHLYLVEGTMSPCADDVLLYHEPTKGYCCTLTANEHHKIEFESFRIRDMDSGVQLFEVAKDPNQGDIDVSLIPVEMEDQVRCISYDFGEDFLALKSIGTTLQFSVGPEAVENFRMIERHYFRDQLIKSFDFNFGFCIPNSTNTWEAIYDMPDLPDDLIQAMIDNPWDTKSDSFYYAGDEMILHNKANYAYSRAS